jgi:hypothetical protein
MSDVEIKIPVGLTAAHIERVNPDTRGTEAQALALHTIIGAYKEPHSACGWGRLTPMPPERRAFG